MTATTQSETIAQPLGKIVSGVHVLTCGHGNERQGILVSWVAQAGFKPPALTVALEHDREILTQLQSGAKFILNIVNEDNTDILKRFGKYQPDQFENLPILETPEGIILKDTVGYLVCEVKSVWSGGDHRILYAEITDGEMLNVDTKPWVHIRKNGFSY